MSKKLTPNYPFAKLNGFESWHETHFEVVSEITQRLIKPDGDAWRTCMTEKHAVDETTSGMYELAYDLTNKFERINKGRKWDGEFFEEVEEFCRKELDTDAN